MNATPRPRQSAIEARRDAELEAALVDIAEMVPTEDEWRSAADFMEAVAKIVHSVGIVPPAHYAE